MKSDNAIRNGTSIFVGIIVAIAAFVRGALLLPLLLAQKIDADVARQAEQPCGKRRVKLVLIQRPPGADECLLRQIQGIVRIFYHAQAQIIYAFLVFKKQLLKRILVAGLRPADQKFILHALTSDPV